MKDASEEFAKQFVIAMLSAVEEKYVKIDCAKLVAEVTMFALIIKLALIKSVKVIDLPFFLNINFWVIKILLNNFFYYAIPDPCLVSNACGVCAQCSVINHGIQCSCPADFIGNPLSSCSKAPLRCQGRICDCDEAGYCTRSCGKSSECDCGEKCVNRKCRQQCSTHNSCPQVSC